LGGVWSFGGFLVEGGGVEILARRQGEYIISGRVKNLQNCTGEVWFTDIMLQPGSIATGWVGHVCEIKWTMDG
jgi:hypothetical protein